MLLGCFAARVSCSKKDKIPARENGGCTSSRPSTDLLWGGGPVPWVHINIDPKAVKFILAHVSLFLAFGCYARGRACRRGGV